MKQSSIDYYKYWQNDFMPWKRSRGEVLPQLGAPQQSPLPGEGSGAVRGHTARTARRWEAPRAASHTLEGATDAAVS